MYQLVSNAASDLKDWSTVFQSSGQDMGVLNTVNARASLISLVTGKELISCFSKNCYISYNLAPMYGVKTLGVRVNKDNTAGATIPIVGIPPYVSGSLIMGAVASDITSTMHLRGQIEFEVRQTCNATPEHAFLAASVYRLFGHELDLKHARTMEQYNTYANVSDSVISPADLLELTNETDAIEVGDSVRRPGRSETLPSGMQLRMYGKCNVTIEMPTVHVYAWARRETVYRPQMVLASRKKAVTFKVSNSSQFEKHTYNSKAGLTRVKQDFHEAVPEVAPVRPVLAGASTSIVVEDLQDSGAGVVDVE
jgi:hypothetical protein